MKKQIKVMSLFCSILFLLFLGIPGRIEAQAQDRITMNVECGLEGTIIYGWYMPVTMDITSEFDMEGTVSIGMATNIRAGYYYDASSFNQQTGIRGSYFYRRDVSLKANETQRVVMSVPYYSNKARLRIQFTDKQGNLVYNERVDLEKQSNQSQIYLGVFSNHQEDYNFLSNILMGNELQVTIRRIELQEDTFPVVKKSLDILDCIFVDDTSLQGLGDKQWMVLLDWMKAGGSLIFQSEENQEIILNRIQGAEDEFVTTPFSLGKQYPWVLKSLNYFKGKIFYLNIPFEEEIMTKEDKNQTKVIQEFFRVVIGGETMNQLLNGYYSYNSSQYNYEIANSIPFSHIPKPGKYAFVLVCYLLLAGPLTYFILVKKKKQKYFFHIIVGYALVFSMIIFIMGGKTRFVSPFMNYARIYYMDHGEYEDNTYISVRAPFNKEYELYINKEYDVYAAPDISIFQEEEKELEAKTLQVGVSFSEDENEKKVTLEKFPAFEQESFVVSKAGEQEEELIVTDVHFFQGKVSGTVKNQTGTDLENTALLFKNYFAPIGTLKNGESYSLDQIELKQFQIGSVYEIGNRLLGYRYDMKLNSEENYTKRQKRFVLDYFTTRHFKEGTVSPVVIGFSSEANHIDFQRDTAYKSDGRTLYVKTVKVDYTQGDLIYNPNVQDTEKIISGSYSDLTHSVYEKETELIYECGRELEDIQLYLSMDDIYEEEYYSKFSGKLYFYNWMTKEYDLMNVRKTYYNSEELKPYLSTVNQLKMKYEKNRNIDNYDSNEKQRIIYKPTVIGRLKDA